MRKFSRLWRSKKDRAGSEDQTQRVLSRKASGDDENYSNTGVYESPRLGNVPKQSEGEQVAAGWPEWLSAVAGEALRGWLPRRADSFQKIDKIGQGTYSNVYKARDLESGQIVALKKVRFDNLEPESVKFMAREIKILRRLGHPNVVNLEGLVTSRMSCSLYLVFEFMDHDLAGIAASPNVTFTEAQVKCYLSQILKGLDHCHSRGVLHRDIKGSNLLLDTQGNLKIADFGLATFFQPDKQQQLTTRVVTLWYRPPELLLGATEYGAAIDIWSVGCILGELFARRPILPGRTEVEQLHKIFKLCGSPPEEYWTKYKLSHATIFKPQHPYKRMVTETFEHFPQTALDLLDVMLAFDPEDRGTASTALQSHFFNTEPFACEPSSLPKYAPSKVGGKGRDVKGRRKRATDSKAREVDGFSRDSNQEDPRNEIIYEKPGRAPNQSSPSKNTANQEGKGELRSSTEARLSKIQSSRTTNARFSAQATDLASSLSSAVSRQHTEKGKDRVYAIPLGPAQSNTGVANLSWAGLKPQDEGPAIVRTCPLVSRSVRYTTATFESASHGGSDAYDPGARLSKLSTLVASRNNSRQVSNNDGSETKMDERVPASKARNGGVAVAVRDPMKFTRGLDGFDMEDNDVQYGKTKTSAFGPSAPRRHFSGPLLPPSANVEQIMHEHEREIQKASRRARHGRYPNRLKGESELYGGRTVDEILKEFSVRDTYYDPPVTNSNGSKMRSTVAKEILEEGNEGMDAPQRA